MTVFMGSWENPDLWYRFATILACASIVVTAVYILRATGQTIMGPMSNSYETIKDASWNEKLAAGLLITGILIIGVAPFLINQLVTPGTEVIVNKLSQVVR
jgi:NADH-quinone oxidoreductase subunit M